MANLTGDVADVYDKENFPLFQTGSGKAVSVSVASIQKAKAVLEQNNTGEDKIRLSCLLNFELNTST